jgi:hypothetical protein
LGDGFTDGRKTDKGRIVLYEFGSPDPAWPNGSGAPAGEKPTGFCRTGTKGKASELSPGSGFAKLANFVWETANSLFFVFGDFAGLQYLEEIEGIDIKFFGRMVQLGLVHACIKIPACDLIKSLTLNTPAKASRTTTDRL